LTALTILTFARQGKEKLAGDVIIQSRVGEVASQTDGIFINQRHIISPHGDYPPVTEGLRGGDHSFYILWTADILRTSEMTAKVHRSRLMQMMQMHWVAHLVRLAEKVGLTMP
jgi:hypothetical protein